MEAALARDLALEALLVREDVVSSPPITALMQRAARPPVILGDRVFASIVDAETPQGIAAEIAIPHGKVRTDGDSVFLEGVQDAGNVGAIIRSAAAFGLGTVYLDKGCADAWSPKVLRAASGAHFALSLVQAAQPPQSRLVCAVAHGGEALSVADLSGRVCWVFGAEGRGVSSELQGKAAATVTIPVAASVESLNVAAAAAICFYEAFSRRARGS